MKIKTLTGLEKEISDSSIKYTVPAKKYIKIVFHNGDEILVKENEND